jgi:hypothetical protein
MAQAIVLSLTSDRLTEVVRTVLVIASAAALILAGKSLPF